MPAATTIHSHNKVNRAQAKSVLENAARHCPDEERR